MSAVYFGFIFYLALMLAIGIYSHVKKPVNNMEDFIVGNRSFGPVLSAFGVSTTLASGYAFIGLVGAGYLLGALALWQPILTPILEFILWVTVAKKVRRFSLKTNSLTPIEVLSKLRGDPYNLIKVVGGLAIGIFMFVYLAGNFVAGAKAASILNIPFSQAVVLTALVVIAYTFIGGVRAVMITDAIQGALMIVTFFLIFITALVTVGGFGEMFTSLMQLEPLLVIWTGGKVGWALAVALMLWMGIALGFLGQPQAIQKFITIKDDKSIPKAAMISILFNSVRQYFPIIIGLTGRVIFPDISDPELVVPHLIIEYFPNILGGIMLASIFAAIMSTTDSLLLQATSEISRNVIQLSLFKNITQKQSKTVIRLVTLIIGGLGVYAAINGSQGVFSIIAFAFVGLTCAIAPALFFGLYWKKTTSWGILSGIAMGITATVVWKTYLTPITQLSEGVPSFVITVLTVLIISLLTQKSNANLTEDNAVNNI